MNFYETIERKEQIACSIIRCIEAAWKDGELVDVTVTVDSCKFECHSFLLGACSEYFKQIFKTYKAQGSGSKKMCVTLTHISVDIFGKILNAIYTGTDIVKEENLIDVWRAAHKLQILFLEEDCERFAMCNLNLQTYPSIYAITKEYQATKVMTVTQDFIAKNFHSFKDSELLLQLSGDELLTILNHSSLLVKTEDFVMESVLKWISSEPPGKSPDSTVKDSNDNNQTSNYSGKKKSGKANLESAACKKNLSSDFQDVSQNVNRPVDTKNNLNLNADSNKNAPPITVDEVSKSHRRGGSVTSKSDFLIPLLRSTRTCLLSTHCLNHTYLNKHISSNPLAREIIFKAALYQTGYKDHGQWPNAAVHRKYSPFENVGLCLRSNGFIEVLSFERNAWCTNILYHQLLISEAQITVFDQELYAAGLDNVELTTTNVSLFALKGLKWVRLCDFPNITSFRFEGGVSFQPPYIPHIVENSFLNQNQGRAISYEGSVVTLTAVPPMVKTYPMHPITANTALAFESVVPEHASSVPPPLFAPAVIALPSNNLGYSLPPPNQSPLAASMSNNQSPVASTSDTRAYASTPASPSKKFAIKVSPSSDLLNSQNESCPQSINLFTSAEQTAQVNIASKSNTTRTKPTPKQSADWLSRHFHIASLGRYIYYINSFTHLVFKINPCFTEEILEIKYFLGNEKIEYVSTYDELLLVFCSALGETNKTIIYSFNTNTDQASKAHILDGPAAGLITFQDDVNKYMLQSNGALWNMTREGNAAINFGLFIKLWDFDFKLNGGVFYNGEIYLHGQDPAIFQNFQPQYPAIFDKIHIYGVSEKCSKFVPFIILRKCWAIREG